MMSGKIKSSKTNLLRSLQRAYTLALISKRKNIPPAEFAEEVAEKISRRRFIQTTGKAALITTVAGGSFISSCTSGGNPEIVIVGSGMAGLHAAFTLKKSGLMPKIYEASSRSGGRMYTAKDLLGEGLTTELGGEFIDSTHTDMFNLIKEFNLPLIDTFEESEMKLNRMCYYFEGRVVTNKEVMELFYPYAEKIQQDVDSLSDYISYKEHSESDLRLDNLSIAQYLTGIGISGLLYNLLDIAYTTEYGLDIASQSSINFLYLIDPGMKDEFNYSGYSDERYKIKGGNQSATDSLTKRLQYQLYTDHTLESISSKEEGKKIILSFIKTGGSVVEVEADYVILTLPFTVMRDIKIDYPFSPQKTEAIKNMSYGMNAKLLLGFNKPFWRDAGYSGYAFADNGIQTGWDNSQLQGKTAAGYTVYTGGDESNQIGFKTNEELAEIFIPRLGQFFGPAKENYNTKVSKFHWPTFKYTKASYTCFSPGQFTTIEGAQSEPEGNIFFAGEHCSFEFQGFMNGAAETGRVAAENILKKLNKKRG
ncbi:MAG: flavin monoamine oxidase family protein [Chitinophagales bacterium]